MQVDRNIGIEFEEIGQDRRDPTQSERHLHGEPDQAAWFGCEFKGGVLSVLRVGEQPRGACCEGAAESVKASRREVRLKRRAPSVFAAGPTARETVATDTPISRAAAAKERSSATLANIASPSKSGSFIICKSTTMICNHFDLEK